MKASQGFLGFSSHCFLLACTFFQSLVPDFSHTGKCRCQPQSHSPLCSTSRKPPPYLYEGLWFWLWFWNNYRSFIFDVKKQLVNLWRRRPRLRLCGPERKRGSLWRHRDSAVISRHPGPNQGSWGAAPCQQNKAFNYMLLFTQAHDNLKYRRSCCFFFFAHVHGVWWLQEVLRRHASFLIRASLLCLFLMYACCNGNISGIFNGVLMFCSKWVTVLGEQ